MELRNVIYLFLYVSLPGPMSAKYLWFVCFYFLTLSRVKHVCNHMGTCVCVCVYMCIDICAVKYNKADDGVIVPGYKFPESFAPL